MIKGPAMDRCPTWSRRGGAVAAAAALALALAGCQSTSKSAAASVTTPPSTAASPAASPSASPTTSAPAATTTRAAAPRTSAHPSTSAAAKGGAGTNCGLEQATPNPNHLYLVIVSGNVTCEAAQKQMTEYLAYPDKQGSGGFATVNGWQCDHNSLAGFEEDGHFAECSGPKGDIVTQTATAKTP